MRVVLVHGRAAAMEDIETWGRAASPTAPAGAHDALDDLSSRVVGTAVDAALRVL